MNEAHLVGLRIAEGRAYVRTPFNETFLVEIKRFANRKWHPETREWSVPEYDLQCLAALLDAVYFTTFCKEYRVSKKIKNKAKRDATAKSEEKLLQLFKAYTQPFKKYLRPGFVYFVMTEDLTQCKIGFSRDPRDRIKSLQTGNASRLHIACIMPGTERLEFRLHDLFRNQRRSGEWFDNSNQLFSKCAAHVIESKLNVELDAIDEHRSKANVVARKDSDRWFAKLGNMPD